MCASVMRFRSWYARVSRTALLLHERYGELVEAGTLDSTLRALYDYGAVHGWDPLGAAGDGGSFGVAAAQATV